MFQSPPWLLAALRTMWLLAGEGLLPGALPHWALRRSLYILVQELCGLACDGRCVPE